MEELSLDEKREKIIQLIKEKGPSLPIQIAKEIEVNSLIAGALLSGLVSEKEVKISYLKIGGSPVYFLEGQEPQLEKFHTHLPLREKQAFQLLRQKQILKDSEQEPAVRVALRQIRDFAMPFKDKQGDIFWRFFTASPEKPIEKPAPIKKPIPQPKPKPEKPLLELKPRKIKKEKPKSDFVENILGLLRRQEIEVLEELEVKKKEYLTRIRINSQIGKIQLLCLAKDKKRISNSDIDLAHSLSNKNKLPILFLTPGEPTKKTKEYLKEDPTGYLLFKKLNR